MSFWARCLAKDLAQTHSAEALATILDEHRHLHAPGKSVDVLELLAMPGKWEASRGPGYPDRPASGWIPGPSCVRVVSGPRRCVSRWP